MVKRYRVRNLFGDRRRVLNERNEWVTLKKNETAVVTKRIGSYMSSPAFKVTEIKEIEDIELIEKQRKTNRKRQSSIKKE